MSFWNRNNEKHLNSAEYESIAKKLVEISSRVEELENKFKILGTNYDNLRGQFNRKLSGLKKEEEVGQEEEKTESDKDIKPNIFLSPDGTLI